MKLKKLTAAGAALLILALTGTGSASAAVQVGSGCAATNLQSMLTITQRKAADPNLVTAAPAAGVLTKWQSNVGVSTEPLSLSFKVLRPGTGTNVFSTVAESSVTVSTGSNSFDARVPIQAGDRFGIGSTGPVPFCLSASEADEILYFEGNLALGQPPSPFGVDSPFIVPILATVEADADGDGFGDESQDKCPRSKALQAVECPLITLGGIGKLKKRSAQILVSASSQASVTVFGTVKVPKKGKKGKVRQITMQGGTKSVSPGAVVPFSLVYTPTLKSALAGLPPSKSLPLAVTMTTTDLAGVPTSTPLTLKLKGQKQAKAKGKGKGKGNKKG